MKKIFLSSIVAAAFAVGSSYAQLISGSDNANNYTLGQSLNGTNAGSGFSPWSVVDNNNGTTIFAGAYIGNNTNQNGRASIGSPTQIFGLYANATAGSAFVDFRRGFTNGSSMTIGDSFSWQGSWSWAGGNRGFSLYSDTNWTTEILNLNHGGSDALTYAIGASSGTAISNIFNQAFTVNMTFLSGNNLQLQVSTASSNFSQSFAIGGAPSSFKWYFSGAPDGSANYEPNINNLSATAVPEPSTYALLAVSALALGGYAARRRARK